MRKYIIMVIAISCMAVTNSNENKLIRIEENCVNAYERVDELIQFLNKFDGNLPNIKSTKVNSLKYLIAQFEDYKIHDSVRRKAFDELYNDPDYYQYLIQEKSSKITMQLQIFRERSSPIKDRNLIFNFHQV